MKRIENSASVKIRLSESTIAELDKLSISRGYASRAAVIRVALQKFIKGEMKNEINN